MSDHIEDVLKRYWASRVWVDPKASEKAYVAGMWNYTGPWYPGHNKSAEPKKTNTPHIPTKAEEKKEEEKPKKRRNLTSWPPTPE